jgi:hypothetical protein
MAELEPRRNSQAGNAGAVGGDVFSGLLLELRDLSSI